MSETTSFSVNGRDVQVRSDHPHLLAALREELGVTSPKDGCSPSGQCGACTVLLDGKAIQSCLVNMEKAEGKAVTTLEGFEPAERDRLSKAFAVTGALQCGFCTPGILVRTKALFDQKGPAGVTSQVAAGRLGAHLCRCTGYAKILEAVEMLASGDIPEPSTPQRIGDNGAKYEGVELALGDRGYVDDMYPDGMLHGALRLTDHARADIVRIDTTAAEAAEGVVGVFTGADVPGELKVGIIYTDWPVFIPEGGRTSYYGDVLAIVVAETKAQARAATELVEVEYNVLKPFADAKSALASDEDAGVSTATFCRPLSTRGEMLTKPSPVRHILFMRCSRPSGSSMPSSNRSRPLPWRMATATSWCIQVARVFGTIAIRSHRCSVSSKAP